MKSIVQFSISKGEKLYVAHAIDFPIFTQADTLDELMDNIREATELHFADEDTAELGVVSKPSILVNFEVPKYA